MNEMRPIDSEPDVPTCIVDFQAADRALEKLKNALADIGCYHEALRVSEMLRDLDRTRRQYDQRNNDPL